MSAVVEGRRTSRSEDVTVFLIGMRINRFAGVRDWWPVLTAMPRMLRHLEDDPRSGMLGHHLWFGRTFIVLSYWRSADHLQRFASDPAGPHLEPWRRFVRAARSGSSVGIWHETYVVPAGAHETIYVDMPEFGLAAAVGDRPIGPGLHTARQRLAAGS